MSRFTPYHLRHGAHDDLRESDASYTLEDHIASLRRDKTPEEIAALYAEWRALS